MTRLLFVASASALLCLTACSGESQESTETIELTGDSAPEAETRSIDWTAARVARIQAIEEDKSGGNIVLPQSNGAGSPVPVMLPSGIVTVQSVQPIFFSTSDGYVARYQTAKYDIIVNGTNEVFGTSAPDMNEDDRDSMNFTANEAGAQVAMSRFGADYLVEIECRILDGDVNCISEEEALGIAENLFVAAVNE